jgi:hypothetical protein
LSESEDEGWHDEDFVPPYVITNGRTRSRLDPATVIRANGLPAGSSSLSPEHESICTLCRHPLSVAEVAGRLHLPLSVAAVLCGDLVDQGFVAARSPEPTFRPPSYAHLERLLDGLLKL